MGRTALVLGAGMGGIAVAEALRKRLPPGDRVVVAEREQSHVFAPSLLWHITGEREAAAFTRPLAALKAKGIEMVSGEITHIDPAARSAEVGGSTIAGDALIVALGAELAPETVPGRWPAARFARCWNARASPTSRSARSPRWATADSTSLAARPQNSTS